MRDYKIYSSIIIAVIEKKLKEPFENKEFMESCPGFAKGTYNIFLYKHQVGNCSASELFENVSPGKI